MARATKLLIPAPLSASPNGDPVFLDNISGSFTLVLGGTFDGVFKIQQAYDQRDGWHWSDITGATITGSQPTRNEVVKSVTDKVIGLRCVTTTNITDEDPDVQAQCLIVYDEV